MQHVSRECAFVAAACVCAGVGAIYDVRERRIPNRLTAPALLVALAAHAVSGGAADLGAAALAAGLAGGVMLLFFLAGGMGAGDVKLMACVGAFIGLRPLSSTLFETAVLGGVVGLVMALRRGVLQQTVANAFALVRHHSEQGLAPHPELNVQVEGRLRMPFAVPIAAACVLTLCSQLWAARL